MEMEQGTQREGAHEDHDAEVWVVTVDFNPINGSVFKCESCEGRIKGQITNLPRRCPFCNKRLKVCGRGFPKNFLEAAAALVQRGLRSAEA
jgi:hypothetical protein